MNIFSSDLIFSQWEKTSISVFVVYNVLKMFDYLWKVDQLCCL